MMRVLRPVLAVFGLLIVALGGVLAFPQLLFAHHVRHGVYDVWSDRPIPPAIDGVLDDVTRRLAASEIDEPTRGERVFLCNDDWRLALFSKRLNGRLGGVADNEISRSVFIRHADVAANRVIRPDGRGAGPDRPLSYYIAHELTHVLEGDVVGRTMHFTEPGWLLEGYADFVGKGGAFDLAENRRLLLAGDPLLDFKRSGLYRRYHLEVAELIERRHIGIRQLLAHPPAEASALAMVEADAGLGVGPGLGAQPPNGRSPSPSPR